MSNAAITATLSLAALSIGGVIGFLFGSMQNTALKRNMTNQEGRRLKNGWTLMPGSLGRVALLVIVLVAVQLCCPLMFQGSMKWLVSVGVILGYGWTLLKHLQQRGAERA